MYEEQELPSLTIKDKMNYPYLLAAQFLTIQKAILNREYSEQEKKEAVQGLVDMTPDSWKDEEWQKELKKAEVKTIIDHRQKWCCVLESVEIYMEQWGKSPFETVIEYDPNKLFHSCVNLFDRRGLITRRAKTEKHLGVQFDNDGHE